MNNTNNNEVVRALWYANVLQHFPDKSILELQDGFEIWMANKKEYADLYNKCTVADLCKQPAVSLNTGSGIWLTFHFGPYRLLPRILIASGYKVTLLASARIIAREQQWYEEEMGRARLRTDVFDCIVADNNMVLKQVLTHVKQRNRWVLIYLDADEGLQQDAVKLDGSLLKVPLHKGHVYWRTNILKLAERFKITVAIGHLTKSEIDDKWRIDGPHSIGHEDSTCCDAYHVRCSTQLVQTFQQMIKNNWLAWENWALLHRYQKEKIAPVPLELKQPVLMMPMLLRGKPFFFDMRGQQFFEIKSIE
ncbi:lysophospholipid acyltransferase family protein [Sphingobacterium pedocola]|uniref:Uncharacterized protein n=1 Tax=Sphingobacterium pedocola TaxID=2082722 RepID=A0ABR9T360_9SPHI|nr:hypothetical protein [Sphingobacterium pedocola]MBE8719783.1 hypothetical protein [Sphingobacterium pedocola]